MLRHRLPTGALLIAGLVGLMWLDAAGERFGWPRGVVLFCCFFLVLAPLMARELAALFRGAGVRTETSVCVAAAWGGVVATAGFPGAPAPSPDTLALAVSLLTLVAVIAAAGGREARGASAAAAAPLLAFVACGVLPGFWLKVRDQFGAEALVACVLTVKASDIGAYATGHLIGRHKLIPWLSPGKTREGVAGGVVFSALVAMAFAAAGAGRPGVPGVGAAAVAGALLAVAGVVGDLSESLLKRDAGAKDSGRLLPGMGGVLDVVDSLLPAGPLAWVLLRQAAMNGG